MCAWLLTGPHTPEAASASLTTTATNAGATATLQKLEQDLQRVQAEIDACNKDLKEAVFERVLEKYSQELEKRSQELTTVKDSLAELDAAAEELQLDLPGNKERQAAIRKNKLARKKQENRREALEDSIANLRAAIADLRANQKDARSDLAARRKDIYHQLHRLEDWEKRIREQMEKAAAAQPGQPGIFFRLTCSRKMNMRVCLRPFSPWSCIRSPMRLLSFVAFSLSTPPPTFDLSPSLFYFFPQQGFQSLQLGGPLTENQLCTKLCSG